MSSWYPSGHPTGVSEDDWRFECPNCDERTMVIDRVDSSVNALIDREPAYCDCGQEVEAS